MAWIGKSGGQRTLAVRPVDSVQIGAQEGVAECQFARRNRNRDVAVPEHPSDEGQDARVVIGGHRMGKIEQLLRIDAHHRGFGVEREEGALGQIEVVVLLVEEVPDIEQEEVVGPALSQFAGELRAQRGQ